MCLAIPARVAEILENDMAIVEVGGVRKTISLALVDAVAKGDYVIVHVGYALNRLSDEPSLAAETNREALAYLTGAPCLGELPFMAEARFSSGETLDAFAFVRPGLSSGQTWPIPQ